MESAAAAGGGGCGLIRITKANIIIIIINDEM
jgi:hypothetical protein